MFVLNPDPYLLPDYKLSPFRTDDLRFNRQLPTSQAADLYFQGRFDGRAIYYTQNGRSAIHKALCHYDLSAADVVTILTTSGNHYVSGCVTGEIEKCCRWSRKIEAGTKVLFVIHEFGYPYPELEKLKEHGLPIIEDCAYAFYSQNRQETVGKTGDFAIYSFPKMFPLQIGGLLVANREADIVEEQWDNGQYPLYIKNVLSHYLDQAEAITDRRLANYHGLQAALGELGFTPYFSLTEGIVPGAFLFRTQGRDLDLPALKAYVTRHGIQCSVFYGREAFFVPVHQRLQADDLAYFAAVIGSFLRRAH